MFQDEVGMTNNTYPIEVFLTSCGIQLSASIQLEQSELYNLTKPISCCVNTIFEIRISVSLTNLSSSA